ncbi:MAG: hypothetical protein ACRD21_11025 [Vicinamibacteria bacterium]
MHLRILPLHTSRAVLTLALVFMGLGGAESYPGFARKYSPTASIFTFMPCASCHDSFPKLTPFGRRFKENGFRLEGDSSSWMETLRAYPAALKTSSFTTGLGSDTDGSTFGVIKPIAAAGLGSSLSFWIEQPFDVNDNGVRRREIDHAWVGVYDVLRGARPDLLNVRGGAFELDLPFTQARTHNLFAYDPYFLDGGDPEWSLAAPQRGLEISGRPLSWARYSVAFVDSVRRSEEYQSSFDTDLYARFAADFHTTHRVGAFFYEGQDDLVAASGDVAAEHRRTGADFDLRFAEAGVSVYGLYLWGNDSGFGAREGSNGGFIQAEKLATYWLLLTTRYTHVRAAETTGRVIRDSLALGIQAWLRERFRIAFEYRFQNKNLPDEGVLSIDFVL